jgi:hypothetical protein
VVRTTLFENVEILASIQLCIVSLDTVQRQVMIHVLTTAMPGS